ncbi:receptor-like protein kinase FERONIA [Juglans microcarpa x Juglans regia]|uniref:receptor-like protein kinase FERONIA n=1 Tax=Juglans microcarpa x Juglans regia TaxID=2249226 RepID=UPI001B7F145F|nr:receptor-like protein kinase FERONIA [Juglans microcarpa x Juglans regia]
MHTLVLIYLSLFLFLYCNAASATENPQAPYAPTDHLFLDCGNSSSSKTFDGRFWKEDSQFSPKSSLPSTATEQNPSVPFIPYMTARIFHSVSTYSFSLSPGPKFLRLYFYPATYPGHDKTNSYFSVMANGFTLLNNFSAFLTVSALGCAKLVNEYIVNVQTNQRLNITFIPLPNSYAFINGIEVVSMPDYLYTDRREEAVTFIDCNAILDNSTALETVYRLNVGGKEVSGKEDTGMFREWKQDDKYVFDVAGMTVVNNSFKIEYTEDTPASTAPEIVYTTFRKMDRNADFNLKHNLTWVFPVDVGFLYLVRLHFCETMPYVTESSQLVFTIYINNQTAQDQADVMFWSKSRRNTPVYKDYVVRVPNERQGKKDMWLALHPNMISKPTYADAFLNGLEIFKLNQSNGGLAGPNPDPLQMIPPPISTGNRASVKSKSNRALIIAIIGGAVSGVALLAILGFLTMRLTKRATASGSAGGYSWRSLLCSTTTKSTKTEGSSLPSDLCRRFSFSEIKAATNNFDDVLIIGVGGFGNVYKGYVDDGITRVAIKRLKSGSKQGCHEFVTEIATLSQLRHLHLVSLIGYCNDDHEMILVYDYMPRGTLRDHLYNTDNPPLSLKQRLEICIGASRGLQYLHTGAKHMIIHRDVKTTNILLDEKWVAKVSDFGICKTGPTSVSRTHISTEVKGSFGYLDPEYIRLQKLTEKSDVYSFGVVLCEVLSARPPFFRGAEKNKVILVEWVREYYNSDMLDQIIDPFLKGEITPECLKRYVDLAVSCLLDDGSERPSMNDVVGSLEFALQLQESGNDIGRGEDTTGPLVQKFGISDSDDMLTSSSEGLFNAVISSNLNITSSTGDDNFF